MNRITIKHILRTDLAIAQHADKLNNLNMSQNKPTRIDNKNR